MKITINFAAIFAWIATIGYPALKVYSSYYITKREFQYPIWDRDGVQIQRRLHHLIQAYIRNFVVNPEWAGLKLFAFIPVWLMTGWRFWNYFSPWRIKKAPPLCKTCHDKGEYLTKGFIAGQPDVWTKCEQCSRPSPGTSQWNCACCLDTHFIGPNRPCPHCQRAHGYIDGGHGVLPHLNMRE